MEYNDVCMESTHVSFEMRTQLTTYCEQHHIARAQAIRMAIAQLLNYDLSNDTVSNECLRRQTRNKEITLIRKIKRTKGDPAKLQALCEELNANTIALSTL